MWCHRWPDHWAGRSTKHPAGRRLCSHAHCLRKEQAAPWPGRGSRSDGDPPWRYANGTNAWDVNDPIIYTNGTASFGGAGSFTDNSIIWTPHQWQGFSFFDVTQGKASLVIDNTANSLTYVAGNSVPNGSPITVNGGDVYQIRKVVTSLDEPGRGMGGLISNTPPVINGIVAWPNDALEPVYYWNNTYQNVANTSMGNGGYYSCVIGQEIVNGPAPGWTNFVYPHPLVSTNQINPPPPGPINVVLVSPGGAKVTFSGNAKINRK